MIGGLSTLILVLPELVLLGGALSLLMFGVFRRGQSDSGITSLAVVFMGLALVFVFAIPNSEITIFDGLLIQYAKSKNATAIIRGLRAISDFEYEFQMTLMNRSLDEHVSTIFLMPHQKYIHISSSLVKEVASLGGDVSSYVQSHIDILLKNKYK